jgi:hypothetical protein
VQDLKRPARLILTAWVMLIVPLLGTELTLVILNGPALVRTLARSLGAGRQAAVAQFGRAEIAAGMVTVISMVLLVLPLAGLAYILYRVARTTFRRTVLATRGHPALRSLAAAGVLAAAAGLIVHWGVLPLRAGDVLEPVAAWQAPHYPGGTVPGGLKKGSGLILDLGRPVSVSSIVITLGRQRGADMSIEVGNHDAPAAVARSTFRTVGSADDIGGTYTIKVARPVRGRYVLIWFTKLPSAGPGRFAAGTLNVVVRGSA